MLTGIRSFDDSRTPTAPPQERTRDLSLRVLQAAAESMPLGVIVSSEAGRILHANARACAMFGYSSTEVLNRTVDGLIAIGLDELRKHAAADRQQMATDTVAPAVVGFRKDGQSLRLELGASVVPTDEAELMVVSVMERSSPRSVDERLNADQSAGPGVQPLLTEIATRLVTVPPDEIDGSIVRSLEEITAVLNTDGATVFQLASDSTTLVPTHYSTHGPTISAGCLSLVSLPWLGAKLKAGEAAWFTRLEEVQDRADRETLAAAGCHALAVFPIAPGASDSEGVGALIVGSSTHNQPWCPATLHHLRLMALIIGQALDRQRSHKALQRALDQTGSLREAVASQQRTPRHGALRRPSGTSSYESDAAQRTLGQVELVAATPATVLLLGETGSGKEVIAQSIHDLSPRRQRPMIRVSCAAIPSALIESELFGRERGAYTGALSRQIGRFEAADRSTLFLDEIGDLPAEMQVKLLRVLQEHVFERLGSSHPIKVDVRIIAATNRNLEKAVEDKTFRDDLYYRLNVFPIVVPPLRERVEDIPALVWGFVDEFSKSFGRKIESISQDAMQRLQAYTWPGNIRELRNVVERAVIVSTGPRLEIPMPTPAIPRPSRSSLTLVELEAEHIRSVLESSNWRVRGPGGAAARLGLKPTTLESRMARLGIKRGAAQIRVA
jgi:formate hydrogenlyase transcriptional activator